MKAVLVILGIICFFIISIVTLRGTRQEVVYDCGMAEWHPDIPAVVKEECRRIRQRQLKDKQLVI